MFYHPDVSPNPTPNLSFTKNKLFCDAENTEHRTQTYLTEALLASKMCVNFTSFKKGWRGDLPPSFSWAVTPLFCLTQIPIYANLRQEV